MVILRMSAQLSNNRSLHMQLGELLEYRKDIKSEYRQFIWDNPTWIHLHDNTITNITNICIEEVPNGTRRTT